MADDAAVMTETTTDLGRGLDAVGTAQRRTLRAEARRESAIRELDAARSALQDARSAQWDAVRAAREAGATFAEIAGVLGVSVQRAQAIAAKPPKAARR